MFTVHAPAGSAKLASDCSAETFLEFMLDTSANRPQVLGRVSRERGRQRVIVDERPLAAGKAVAELTEEDVAAFLVAEMPKLVGADSELRRSHPQRASRIDFVIATIPGPLVSTARVCSPSSGGGV